MLSRVGESLYWMARYIERAEDLARIINVNANLVLDLPRHIDFGWEPLIAITGSEDAFHALHDGYEERAVVRFLVSDRRNPGSIISSLELARENLRTTRDIVPREAWELLNDMVLYARRRTASGVPKRGRYEFLKDLIGRCQQLTGLLAGTMSRTEAYWLVKTGRYLERADMTTRILDVRSEDLLVERTEDLSAFDNIQWMSVLKSLTGYQMYRHHVRVRVRGADVLRFLLKDPLFPRAVVHCLGEVEACAARLPRHEDVRRAVARIQRRLKKADVEALIHSDLHDFLDKLQVDVAKVHTAVDTTWFKVET